MKLGKKMLALALSLLFSIGVVTGCNRDTGEETALSGSLQIAGSTSVQGLSEELAGEFMARNRGVKINVAGGGSGAGIKAAQDGTADIGASSRELKPEEKQVQEHLIAKDGIAVIVHKDNPVDNLSLAQMQQVFAGEITNWRELGGNDAGISLVVREEGSGTRGAFEEIVLKDKPFPAGVLVQNSTGAVRTAVAGNPDAIGFISIGSMNDEVKALKVDGVEATTENVLNGSYKIARPFLYLTKEEPQGTVKAFIDFVLSDDGQSIIEESGFVPVR